MNMTLNDLHRLGAKLDPDLQVRLATALVTRQRQQQDLQARIETFLRSAQGQAIVRRVMVRKQQPRYQQQLITRSRPQSREAQARELIRQGKRQIAETNRQLAEWGYR